MTDHTFDLDTWLEKYRQTVDRLSENLRARAREFSGLASEVQESVSSFAAEAAARTAGTKQAA